ncbi:MAG: EAL domain-containing protein, partial [Lachnospiraceae bacterium]|nr:EAL domain-containing protein [Lachnospiraceae bacterium]
MRMTFTIILTILEVVLCILGLSAYYSGKKTGKASARLMLSLILPILGNIIIVSTEYRHWAIIGYYFYFLGMDLIMVRIISFTTEYCGLKKSHWWRKAAYVLLLLDVIQYGLNPVLNQAFTVKPIIVESRTYYSLVAYWGQTCHRILDYSIIIIVCWIFVDKARSSRKIYSEKYTVILAVMVFTLFWESYYIFSKSPIDRSMLGFGVFGILIYYFTLYYKPVRLLDRMLANIVSDMSQALYFFDKDGLCVWANSPGKTLLGLGDDETDKALASIIAIFGELPDSTVWSVNKEVIIGGEKRYFTIESDTISDDYQKFIGMLVTISDETMERKAFERELYEARHDRLTGLYSKDYLFARIEERLLDEPDVKYQAAFIDVKNFKLVNDIFGTAFGDFAICSIADLIRANVSPRCIFGRLAGDTFGVFGPVEDFKETRTEKILDEFVVNNGTMSHHVLIHVGVYYVGENKGMTPSLMFDRAHMALSGIKDDFKVHVAYYDDGIRQKKLWDQQISLMLNEAITKRQIVPFLQPITDNNGTVVGAEALARWIHPKQGLLSPAEFIPVFEKNGMIVDVDKYIWRCACEILADWKEKNINLFLSVNISPKDFYFTDVVNELQCLVDEYNISPSKLRVE